MWGGTGYTALRQVIVATATGNTDWGHIAAHELGHAFGLADEYPYIASCDSDGESQWVYRGAEPTEPNVTTSTDRNTLKWSNLVNPNTPIPTIRNQDCRYCPSNQESSLVGTFEGAKYYHCGLYRSAVKCIMKEPGPTFCAVCNQAIGYYLGPHTPDEGYFLTFNNDLGHAFIWHVTIDGYFTNLWQANWYR
ncbi:MAG TPA: M64 family metallopeptidase, partial [Ktedonobacteraceae bacterium]